MGTLNWHNYFTYDPETGNLIWKERPQDHFKNKQVFSAWNNKHPRTRAGTLLSNKGTPLRVTICIDSNRYGAHRIIWEMYHGPIPEGIFVDHMDGNAWNNRLCNLRLASRGDNKANSVAHRTNRSGFKGVHRRLKDRKERRPWMAYISVKKKRIHIGNYYTKGLAAGAYAKASIRYFGKFSFYLRPK